MLAFLRPLLILTLLTTARATYAQQPDDAPPETAIRLHLPVPEGGIAIWETRTDKRPVRRWPSGRQLYVQTAPDTTWFRVLIAGNSYFVRQREMPVPNWKPGSY